MATAQSSSGSIVPRLMATVKQLTPAELRDFKRRFADWQHANGEQADEEKALVEACEARLSAADERRLKTLIGKSERGALRPNELQTYRTLVRRAEKLDATRLAALAQLARRWGRPVRDIIEIIGWKGGDDQATRDSAATAKAGARSRR